MEYSKLISISGKGGLFEVLSSKSDGAIVKGLEDGKTEFISSRLHQFSHLESIEVYTVNDNVNLIDIFKAMQESSEALPDSKDDKAVEAYFKKVYKDMDFDRVYKSDMKKMVKWIAILQKNNVELKLSEGGGEDVLDDKKEIAKPKAAEQKQAAPKKAPTQKINAPRKMA